MPTEAEERVLKLLTAVEIPPDAGADLERRGNDHVTVVCEAALGTYTSLPLKHRMNAIFILGQMSHPQAREALPLVMAEADPDVAIPAMRAAGRQRNAAAVAVLRGMLEDPATPRLLAAESVKALRAIDDAAARDALAAYEARSPRELPHRGDDLVVKRLGERR